MTDSPIVYKSGDSVGKILAGTEPVTPTPTIPETPVVPTTETPAPETPAATTPSTPETPDTPENPVVTPEPEKNTSVIDFAAYQYSSPEVPATTVPETQQATTVSWKDEVKKNPDEALKEIGVSEFAIELDKHIKNGGDPADYLAAKAIDYNKISDDEIVKNGLRKQFPTFTPQQIDLFFNRKYVVSEDAEQEDKDFASLQLKADAHNQRQNLISEQQKFKIAAPIPKAESGDQQSQEEAIRIQEEGLKWFSEHEATKALMTSKRVTLNLGENGTFNFDVSQPEFVTRAMTTPDLWQKLTATKSGEPDVVKLQKLVLYASNPEKYESDLVNYGKTLGLTSVVDEGRNITPPHKVIPMTPENAGKPQGYKTGKVSG